MTKDKTEDQPPGTGSSCRPGQPSPAAQRALAEAAERRALQDARMAGLEKPVELAGRGGLEPVRYTDWEVRGIAVDF